MTQSSEASGDQVLVECSSLPPLLRNDLQAFLERQPEVRAVTRRLHTSDALLNPDTVGLVAPLFDLVVHLAERPRPLSQSLFGERATVQSPSVYSCEIFTKSIPSRKCVPILYCCRIDRCTAAETHFRKRSTLY